MRLTCFPTCLSIGLLAVVTSCAHGVADESVVQPDAQYEILTIHGWTVHLNKALRSEDSGATEKMLNLLDRQLKRVVRAVPSRALTHLKRVPVWINPQYDGVRPRAEYHPGEKWLRDNGRDPKMVKAIEITNVSIFPFEDRRMPYLMLHELAHAYHDLILSFDEPQIIEAFTVARDSGSYDAVQRYTGRKTITDKAYALSNHKEYFAETSEAFFGKNDFYPFNRDQLEAHDPQMYNLLQTLWHRESAQ